MRALALLTLAALLLSCGPSNTSEVVLVASVDCRAPQTDYLAAHVADLDALGGPRWRMVAAGESATLTVRCREFTAAETAAGRYALGGNEVEIDPARAQGELAFTAVLLHEAIHWAVGRGPHPERTRRHVCQFADDAPAGECYLGAYDATAVMRASAGLMSRPSTWSGSVESVDVGDVPNFVITRADQRYYADGVAP